MTILVVRSWPAPTEPCWAQNQPHVVDQIERVETREYDYRPVRDRLLASDAVGVINLDWDIAVSSIDLGRLRAWASCYPEAGRVAPYWLPAHDQWAHRRVGGRWITNGDGKCAIPGWGAIYVPRRLLAEWQPTPADPRLTDQNFGAFWAARGVRWLVEWSISAVHLHQ